MANKGPSKSRRKLLNQNIKDPVEVYCRVRPLEGEEESCAVVKPPNILQIIPSSGSHAYKNGERIGTQHTFRKVFDGKTIQKQIFDEIALPLVEDVIQGKNGLLFAYGITNSGKTYTMSGEPNQPGILPRIMDVLFNTITDVQTPKCVFRPDTFNGFNVYTETNALLEFNKKKPRKISPRARSEMPEFGNRVTDSRSVPGVDEDNSYTVFISYVEIYNNFVYDLLEEPTSEHVLHPKPPSARNMREDSKHNMYINGGTEVEVSSTEEAYDVLLQGQRKRRVAETQLNHDSSRSHAVFNIRVVQAPLDPTGAEVLQDSSKIVVSQLSLVDLAGSERVSRTCNEGDRLREAGNINQSLMVLRNCMEILRENHINGITKHVPYRDSKLTHFFKNHFDGDGKVRMIVCISPNADNYDETIHVMKFAEVTQEVVVERSTAPKVNVGLAPGRRRANLAYKSALEEVNSLTKSKDIIHPYKVALGVICLQKYLGDECSVRTLSEFKAFLENRHKIREQLIEDLHQKQADFRCKLMASEQEMIYLKTKLKEHQTQNIKHERSQRETARLKSVINTQQHQITQLTAQVNKDQKEMDELKKIVREYETVKASKEKSDKEARKLKDIINTQKHQVDQLESQLDSYQTKAKEQIHGRVAKEREKFESLAQEMEIKEQEYLVKDEKLRQVKELIKNSPLAAVRNSNNTNSPFKEKKGQKDNKTKPGNPPLYNKAGGRKRSLSENWLEHNPADTVNNGDLLQPRFKKKKTITNPKPKHFNLKKVDKYVLKHQEQDSEGDVQTELYKGEILQTKSGGASVKFTDIEKLKHSTTERNKRWTRSMSRRVLSNSSSMTSLTDISIDGDWTDVETRCAVGIEGKPGSSPAYSHIVVNKRETPQ